MVSVQRFVRRAVVVWVPQASLAIPLPFATQADAQSDQHPGVEIERPFETAQGVHRDQLLATNDEAKCSILVVAFAIKLTQLYHARDRGHTKHGVGLAGLSFGFLRIDLDSKLLVRFQCMHRTIHAQVCGESGKPIQLAKNRKADATPTVTSVMR
jgi:hypothetical protein